MSNTYGMPGISETSESILYRPVDASLVLNLPANPTGSEDIILSKLAAATGAPAWTKDISILQVQTGDLM